eukprot:5084435-Amphidinium_carterae.1
MWAVLAWMQVLAAKTEETGKLHTVEDVAKARRSGSETAKPESSRRLEKCRLVPMIAARPLEAHWAEYGRNYYARYDYE